MSENQTFEYVPVRENLTHLDRHFAGSNQPGSKFLPMEEKDKDKIINSVDTALREAFAQETANGQAPGRVCLKIKFDKPVGTDALTKIEPDKVGTPIIITRDAGTDYETSVKLVVTNEVPKVDEITVIAGRYGPTEKWGIFTLFPGVEAPPFPNSTRQKEEAFKASERFWNEHGFLTTAEEIKMAQNFEPK